MAEDPDSWRSPTPETAAAGAAHTSATAPAPYGTAYTAPGTTPAAVTDTAAAADAPAAPAEAVPAAVAALRGLDGTDAAPVPALVGPYRVTGVLGRGGMGVVYAAEQAEPIRRRVAVKVIRTGLPAHVAARFAVERQALALMEHPGIARVLDAGTAADGAPWVAMEYVAGPPIHRWCDERRLPVRERVRLVAAVCHAVQHAHQKGIVHRDLKPSNVLVAEADGQPQPKVIDFGIARAVGDARLPGVTHATEAGALVGTPAYMSPEQAEGVLGDVRADVDTRADVYALGVLLYELLTGTLPADPARAGIFTFLGELTSGRLVVTPPSARAAGRDAGDAGARRDPAALASLRGRDPQALARELRGDLDAIVLRALAPERERRYPTALGLAQDLERFLRNEPVTARAPGAWYRLGKLARRRPALVALAASAAVSLVAVAGVSTVQARRVARARAVAVQRQAQAEALVGFMVGDLRQRLEPVGRLDVLDAAATRAVAYFAAVPAAELSDAEVLHRSEALDQLGQVRLAQGDADRAMAAFRESLAQARALAARAPADAAYQFRLGNAEYWVGYVHYTRGALDSALAHFGPYLAAARGLVARDPARAEWQLELGYALSNLGSVHEAQGDLPRALADFQAVLAVGQRLVALAPGGGGAPARAARDEARNSLGDSHNTLAVVHERMGALDSAGAHFAAALRIKRALAAEDRASAPRRKALGDAFFFAGSNAELRGDLAAARALLDSARAIAVGLTALDTANVDWARSAAAAATRLAALETAAGAPQAAVVHLAAARAGARVLAARAPDDPSALAHQARMAREEGAARAALGDRQGARAAAARAHALLDPVGGRPDLPAHVRWVLALTHLLDATLADAAPARQAAWAGVLRALGPAAPFEEPRHTALRARALVALGRGGEAAPLVARLRRARYAAPGDLALPPSS